MNILEWLSVSGLAALKVLPAGALAIAYKMTAIEIFLSLFIGGMGGITFFAFAGTWLRKRRKSRKKSVHDRKKIRRARKYLRFWKKYGIYGVALLTPPMLSPPIGTAIAVAFGEKRKRLLIFMAISMALWAGLIAILGEELTDLLP